jgi:hypothetical protein
VVKAPPVGALLDRDGVSDARRIGRRSRVRPAEVPEPQETNRFDGLRITENLGGTACFVRYLSEWLLWRRPSVRLQQLARTRRRLLRAAQLSIGLADPRAAPVGIAAGHPGETVQDRPLQKAGCLEDELHRVADGGRRTRAGVGSAGPRVVRCSSPR